VLREFPKSKIHVAIVWIQIPGFRDGLASARRAAARFGPDARVTHFYDPHPSHLAGKAFSKAALPDGKLAWDIYMFFKPGQRWDEVPPPPAAFRHQLGRLRDAEEYRTGEALADDLHAIMHELTGDSCTPIESGE